MTSLESEKLLLSEKIEKLSTPARGFVEMFKLALTFLENP